MGYLSPLPPGTQQYFLGDSRSAACRELKKVRLKIFHEERDEAGWANQV